jgi:hypothetical protein
LAKIEVWYCEETGDIFAYKYRAVDGYELRTPHLDMDSGKISIRHYRRGVVEIPDKEE